jgi:hypothetical protein
MTLPSPQLLRWEPNAAFFQGGPGHRDFIFQVEIVPGALYVISKVAHDYAFGVAMRLDAWLTLERLLAIGPELLGS